jgi:hypothetical protein
MQLLLLILCVSEQADEGQAAASAKDGTRDTPT